MELLLAQNSLQSQGQATSLMGPYNFQAPSFAAAGQPAAGLVGEEPASANLAAGFAPLPVQRDNSGKNGHAKVGREQSPGHSDNNTREGHHAQRFSQQVRTRLLLLLFVIIIVIIIIINISMIAIATCSLSSLISTRRKATMRRGSATRGAAVKPN